METDKSVQNTNNFTTPQGKQVVGSKTRSVSGPLVYRSLEGIEKQRPQEVAHMYVDTAMAGDPSDDWDSEQRMRWGKFLNLANKHRSGGDVLQAMELIEVDMEGTKDQTNQEDDTCIQKLKESLFDQIEIGKRLLHGLEFIEGENETASGFPVDRSMEEPEKQEPQIIAQLYAGSAESIDPVDAQDCEKRLRWENFLKLADEPEIERGILQNTDLVEEIMGEAKEQTRQVEGSGFESL
jgi:hypothetical protein